jgi:hypothetical protein
MKFFQNITIVEAITFDELVQYGKDVGAKIVNGMPWSFNYHGYPVTHENDKCYLIGSSFGTMSLTPGRILVIDDNRKIRVYEEYDFYKIYQKIA